MMAATRSIPLQLAEVDNKSSLMIVSCHYEMAAAAEKKGALDFDVSPDSVTFHLFEAAAAPTS